MLRIVTPFERPVGAGSGYSLAAICAPCGGLGLNEDVTPTMLTVRMVHQT